jgi:hypothetical protein
LSTDESVLCPRPGFAAVLLMPEAAVRNHRGVRHERSVADFKAVTNDFGGRTPNAAVDEQKRSAMYPQHR